MTERAYYLSLSSPVRARLRATAQTQSLALLCAMSITACGADLGSADSSDESGNGTLLHQLGEQGGPSADLGDEAEQKSEYEQDGETDPLDQNARYTQEASVRSYSQYIVLGDSYVAGTGNTDSSLDTCHVSPNAWPYGVAQDLGLPSPSFLACSGARTGEVRSNQITKIGATDQNTLILVGVGGNDLDLRNTLTECALTDCIQTAANSEATIRGALTTNLIYTFRELRTKAPNATIVAMGYPHAVASDATSCIIEPAKASLINGVIDLMNATIAATACAEGVESITTDVVDVFAGREACSNDSYINSDLSNPRDWEIGHPNANGNTAYRFAVSKGFGELTNSCAPASAAPVAAPTPAVTPVPAAPVAAPLPAVTPLPVASPLPAAAPLPATVIPAPSVAAPSTIPGAVPLPQRTADTDLDTAEEGKPAADDQPAPGEEQVGAAEAQGTDPDANPDEASAAAAAEVASELDQEQAAEMANE